MLTNLSQNSEPDVENWIWHYQATIPADISSITPILEQMMELGRETECFSGKEMDIETALREALANAIVHGCKKDKRETVQLSVACDENREILIVVRDPGKGFDPKSIPDPTVGQNIYAKHGRGLYLINQLMDEVCHEQGGREIHMRKK